MSTLHTAHPATATVAATEVTPIAYDWESSSLIRGKAAGRGMMADVISPLRGEVVQRVNLLDEDELLSLTCNEHPPSPMNWEDLFAFAQRLHTEIRKMAPLFVQATQLETGYIERDCQEMVQGSLQFLEEFPDVLCLWQSEKTSLRYAAATGNRQIDIVHCPWGTVAMILPQNAFLIVALTSLFNVLAAGNHVILRAPLQSGRSAALLSLAIRRAGEPWQAISLINARAREFMQALYKSPDAPLIHYMGGSNRAADLLSESFNAGKSMIVDGSGNTWVWVDETVDIEDAAAFLTMGASRYNGQTCTSVNGAIIHPRIYQDLRRVLTQHWESLTFGNPLTAAVDVGPVFDESQAVWCERQLLDSCGTVLCGGTRCGNLLAPTLIEDPAPASSLVKEGIFGAAMWITRGDCQEFAASWKSNRYPLCAGVLAADTEIPWWLARLGNLSRLVVNADPSIEHIHEPWGGYPGSGLNTVSGWLEKYQRAVQVDKTQHA